MPEPREVVRRYFDELWTRRNLAAAEELVALECITHQLRSAAGPAPAASRGPAELREHLRSWFEAFPDLSADVEATLAEGDRVVSWVALRGTNAGPWQGVPATGRPVVIRSVVTHRIADGRIVEDWVVTESLGVYQQLGIVEPTPVLLARAVGGGAR